MLQLGAQGSSGEHTYTQRLSGALGPRKGALGASLCPLSDPSRTETEDRVRSIPETLETDG